MLAKKALHDLKSSGAAFRACLVKTMGMQKVKASDGFGHFECILCLRGQDAVHVACTALRSP
jgi:hypothetical protein